VLTLIEKETVKELVLALLYVTSWEEEGYNGSYHRSWKGYPFELLDELTEENLIVGSYRAKSVYLSEKGVERAIDILNKYNIGKADLNEKEE